MAAKHDVAAGIHKLVKSEADARYDYEDFLAEYKEKLSSADIVAIQEILSDEFNHQLILLAMARKYDGDIAPASDGAAKAVDAITAGMDST
ncbi:MAG: hypothetical protein FWB91_00165 [Defluviitaleaceae bacterium]|nr:hypothetical protein [Defluviitaleaceae bacterium]